MLRDPTVVLVYQLKPVQRAFWLLNRSTGTCQVLRSLVEMQEILG